MKVIHVLNRFGPPETCYTYCNMFQPISKEMGGTIWEFNYDTVSEVFDGETEYLIFEDFQPNLNERYMLDTLDLIRKVSPKISIIACPYDPPNFPLVESATSRGLIDRVVLFDKKFSGRFEANTMISDNILNNLMFETENVEKVNDVCYCGTLHLGRQLPAGVVHISRQNKLSDLYKKAATFKKSIVFDSGLDENRRPTLSYNKAKAIEMLACGTRPYVKGGIDYYNYNHFFRPFELYKEDKWEPINISEIKEINDRVVERLITFIKTGEVDGEI